MDSEAKDVFMKESTFYSTSNGVFEKKICEFQLKMTNLKGKSRIIATKAVDMAPFANQFSAFQQIDFESEYPNTFI